MAGLARQPARAADLKMHKAGAIPIDTDVVMFLAESQGFFAKNGLDVNIQPFNTGDALVAAVLGGDIEFGSINTMSLALARQNGAPLKVIAPGAEYSSKSPTTQMMVLKSSPIATAKDLNGKTVGINVLKGIAHVSAIAWIDKHGGDSKSVKFLEMPFPLMPPALTSNRVDAAVIAEPALTASKADSRVLGNSYDGFAPNWMIDMYVASETWIKANPDDVHRIRAAISATAAWANTHHAESAPVLAKISKLDEAVIEKTTRAVFAESLDPKLIQPIIDVAVQYGILTKAFSASDLIAT